jgi:serine/threonine protein kinase
MTLLEVSASMEYLHAQRITHRDLKPKNILLRTSNKDRRGFRALVSDFGLSQVLPASSETHKSTRLGGTVTHMPPELFESGKVYPQGDTYAFGIIMWEIYTGTMPYGSMSHPQIMVAVVSHKLRPRFPDGCPEWYQSLACKCWRTEPLQRPSFTEIRQVGGGQ